VAYFVSLWNERNRPAGGAFDTNQAAVEKGSSENWYSWCTMCGYSDLIRPGLPGMKPQLAH